MNEVMRFSPGAFFSRCWNGSLTGVGAPSVSHTAEVLSRVRLPEGLFLNKKRGVDCHILHF